jgi:hypothetical protein
VYPPLPVVRIALVWGIDVAIPGSASLAVGGIVRGRATEIIGPTLVHRSGLTRIRQGNSSVVINLRNDPVSVLMIDDVRAQTEIVAAARIIEIEIEAGRSGRSIA